MIDEKIQEAIVVSLNNNPLEGNSPPVYKKLKKVNNLRQLLVGGQARLQELIIIKGRSVAYFNPTYGNKMEGEIQYEGTIRHAKLSKLEFDMGASAGALMDPKCSHSYDVTSEQIARGEVFLLVTKKVKKGLDYQI